MKRALNRFLQKFLLICLVVPTGFGLMFRFRIYPVLTVSQLFDYKVLDAQRRLPGQVRLIVAGSSVALYDLDSKMIADSLEASFYNFGSWGMQISDVGAGLRALVGEYRPSLVVICSCNRDFVSAASPSYAEYARAPAWMRVHFPEWFYVRNYNPVRVLWDRRFKSRRPRLDDWGGASVEEMWRGIPRNDANERLDFPTSFTAMQYQALDSLCGWLRGENLRFVFVQVPTQAEYAGGSGGRGALLAHFERCSRIVKGRGGIYLNYHDPAIFPDSLFADHTHLTVAGGTALTRELIAGLKETIR